MALLRPLGCKHGALALLRSGVSDSGLLLSLTMVAGVGS